MLLPEAGGQDTAVTVTQGGEQVVLDQPYAGARLSRGGAEKYTSNAAGGRRRSSAPRSRRSPRAPAQFTLFFVEGKDEFTDESKQSVDGVFAEIAKRPVPDVIVIGHTDTVGSDAANDALSRQRAEVVRAALARARRGGRQRGQRSAAASASWPCPPADGVAEPRNRRVEILVR